MPSASLLQWQNDRLPRLSDIDAQCAGALTAIPLESDPEPHFIDGLEERLEVIPAEG